MVIGYLYTARYDSATSRIEMYGLDFLKHED